MKADKIGIQKIKTLAGTDTVEVKLYSGSNITKASSPAGTSFGKYETPAFPGGIEKCLLEFNKIKNKIMEFDVSEQKNLDEFLKKNYDRIGGSVSLSVSIAFFRMNALVQNKELYESFGGKKFSMPILLSNIIGGGVHSKDGADIQEFLVFEPKAKSFQESFFKNMSAYKLIEKKLQSKIKGKNIEFAYIVDMNTEEILDNLSQICDFYGLKIGLDVAANSLFDGKNYVYKKDKKVLSFEEQRMYLNSLIDKYNIQYIEDPLNEDDFSGFGKIKCRMVCADDLTATNRFRLKKAGKYVNSSIVKPNQIGNVSDTIAYVKECRKMKITPVVSHRSQETDDDFIAHLAVGFSIPFVKIGLNRISKLNTLRDIEERL